MSTTAKLGALPPPPPPPKKLSKGNSYTSFTDEGIPMESQPPSRRPAPKPPLESKSSGIGGGKKKKKNKPLTGLWGRQSRIIFSFYVFYASFVVFHLIMLDRDLWDTATETTEWLNKTCRETEKYARQAVSFPNYLADMSNQQLTTTANDFIDLAITAAGDLVEVLFNLIVLAVQFQTYQARCLIGAAVDMALAYATENKELIQTSIDSQLASFQTALNTVASGLNSSLHAARQAINGFANAYNTVVISVKQVLPFISFPVLNVNIPNAVIPPVPTMNFPDLSVLEGYSWDSIETDLWNLINPSATIRAAIEGIQIPYVDASIFPQYEEPYIEYCSDLTFTEYMEQVHYIDLIIKVCMGIVIVGMAIYVVCVGFYEYRKYKRLTKREYSYTYVKVYVDYIWYAPALTCLIIALVGIAVFNGLIIGVSQAREIYATEVVDKANNFALIQTSLVETNVNSAVDYYVDAVNILVGGVEYEINVMGQQINETFFVLADLQGQLKDYLTDHIEVIDPVAGKVIAELVWCLIPLIHLPVASFINALPLQYTLPRVSRTSFELNLQPVRHNIEDSLDYSVLAFDWLVEKMQWEVRFYYYLLGFSCGLMVLGLFKVLGQWGWDRYSTSGLYDNPPPWLQQVHDKVGIKKKPNKKTSLQP